MTRADAGGGLTAWGAAGLREGVRTGSWAKAADDAWRCVASGAPGHIVLPGPSVVHFAPCAPCGELVAETTRRLPTITRRLYGYDRPAGTARVVTGVFHGGSDFLGRVPFHGQRGYLVRCRHDSLPDDGHRLGWAVAAGLLSTEGALHPLRAVTRTGSESGRIPYRESLSLLCALMTVTPSAPAAREVLIRCANAAGDGIADRVIRLHAAAAARGELPQEIHDREARRFERGLPHPIEEAP